MRRDTYTRWDIYLLLFVGGVIVGLMLAFGGCAAPADPGTATVTRGEFR